MSLWGTRELYLQGALANARLAAEIYPGWTLRAYCGADVPILDDLRALGVDVRVLPESPRYGGLFWRFLPAGEPDAEYVIVRDADSRLNVREKAAVDAWIASGQPFHVMRDHPQHRSTPILAGMWGCRGGSIPDIAERIARFANGAAKHEDTKFLHDEIWPLVRDRCLVHSSVPDPLGGEAFPPHPELEGFVGEIVDPRAESREVVAVLLPSRGRPEAALAAARSAYASAFDPDRLRIAVGVEPDEADDYRRAFAGEAPWIRVLQSGGSYVRAIRELHRSTVAGIYGFCADDFRFETPGWDTAIRRAAADLPERLGLVHGDDGLQRERLAVAPFVTAEWIACVGDPLPGNYQHMYCDTEISEIARSAGLLRFLPDVKITHHHPLGGEVVVDATYERSATTTSAGRAEFERRVGERLRLAERLEEASHAPLLSILLSSRIQEAGRLDAQLATLHRQRQALADSSVVEVLVEPDAGERTATAKRKRLLTRARGRWVAFVDDEDVADDALAVLLRAVERKADCVTIAGPSGFGFPTSNRVVALRRAVALTAVSRDREGREDFRWSGTLSRFVRSESALEADVFRPRSKPFADAPRSVEASGGTLHGATAEIASPGLPSSAQRLLLTVAVGRDARALRAWEEWNGAVGPEAADVDSIRLFPLVWRNLQRLGVEGIEVNALKPFYWQSWAASFEHVRLATEVGCDLADAGIPALLASGVALAVRYYEQPVLRPMDAVDLLVPRPRAVQAENLLISAGWRRITEPVEDATPLHGLVLRDRDGRRLDLHWDSPVGSRASTGDARWSRADSVDVGGTSMRVLAPADQLLDVCVRGFRWSRAPLVHWVADALAILASAAEQIDWDAFAAEARADGVLLRARTALEYLRGFEAAALDPVCRRLASARCGWTDRIDFRARLRPPTFGRDILLYWLDGARRRSSPRARTGA